MKVLIKFIAPTGKAVHYERRRPEETVLYQLVQEHLETGAGLRDFGKEEFDAFLECGVLVHGFLRLRCADCAHEKLVAFSCKRRGFCAACGTRRMVGCPRAGYRNPKMAAWIPQAMRSRRATCAGPPGAMGAGIGGAPSALA